MKTLCLLLFLVAPLFISGQPYWDELFKPDTLFPSDIAVDSQGSIYVSSFLSSQTVGGIYKSIDNGLTWSWQGALRNRKCITIHNDIILVCGELDIVKSTDYAESWTKWDFDLFADIREIRHIDSTIFIATGVNRIYRSTDNGDTWTEVFHNENYQLYEEDFMDVVFSEKDNIIYVVSRTLYGGVGGVYRSLDMGLTYEPIESWYATMPYSALLTCVMDNDGNLIVGGTGLYRYNVNENSWSILSLNNTPSDILVTPEKAYYFACDFISGSPAGAFVSYDNCNSFTDISAGLESRYLRNFALDEYGRLLAAGYYLQRTIEPVTVRVKSNEPGEFALYPNPFNECIRLILTPSYSSGKKHIRIYKINGQAVHEAETSSNEYVWCPDSNISKGIYQVIITENVRTYSTTVIYN